MHGEGHLHCIEIARDILHGTQQLILAVDQKSCLVPVIIGVTSATFFAIVGSFLDKLDHIMSPMSDLDETGDRPRFQAYRNRGLSPVSGWSAWRRCIELPDRRVSVPCTPSRLKLLSSWMLLCPPA